MDVDWLYGDRLVKLKPLIANQLTDSIMKAADQDGENRYDSDCEYFEPPRPGDVAFRGSDGKYRDSNCEIEYCINLPLKIEGSFSDTVTVRSCPTPKGKDSSVIFDKDDYRIEVRGNPTKFYQGHNCFGSERKVEMIRWFLIDVLMKVGLDREAVLHAVDHLPVLVTRIDLCSMFSCLDPAEWIRQSAQFFDTRANRKRDAREGSLMEGYGSSRLTSIIYDKLKEMIEHKNTFRLTDDAFTELSEFSSGHLRIEHKIKRKKLFDLNMHTLKKLRNTDMDKLYYKLTNDLNVPDNIEVPVYKVQTMKRSHAGVYALWQSGADLRESMPRSSFKRWRKLFSELYSIDIDLPPRKLPETKTLALKRVMVPGRAFVPNSTTAYYFEPELQAAA
jgi:hypothetical protein